MKKKIMFLLMAAVMALSNGIVFSAPIDIPLNIKGIDENNSKFHVTYESDFLLRRDINDFAAKVEANFNSVKVISPIYSSDMARANGYFNIGQAGDTTYKAKLLGQDVTYNMNESIVWGAGVNFSVAEERDKIIPCVDIKYRRIEAMEYESVVVGARTYSSGDLSLVNDANYDEWQAAFLVCKKTEIFLPYVGVKYSDVRVSAKVQAGGTVYQMNTTRSDKILGFVIGCSLYPGDDFNFDIEGRFGDEEAVTLRVGYSF